MEIVKEKKTTVIVLCRCPLQQRIASSITDFIYSHGGTIIDFEQYVDVEMDPASYYARLEWDLGTGGLDVDQVRSQFDVEVAKPFFMEWEVFDSSKPCRLAILGTTEIGGLYKILMSCLSGAWNAEVPLIVSNRTNLEQEAKRFGIAFHHFPITKENKKSQELEMRRLFAEHQIDLVVLARYMQIVSSILIDPYRNRMINIHHSMLPAFVGAKPYHQARRRGVKFIGATGHYVTEELDAGPIIEQGTIRITHRQTVKELMAEGRDLESTVLSKAVELHINRRVIVDGGRTIVFN
ncbi:formyltetrahydrofolate deformylase [Verrucomicrobia bacterium]|nr:formyltetrahydrofolate deformylase [Verrucomicrobiota bacterium]